MSQTKTPTSSLSATELFVMQVRYRTQARIKQLFFALFSSEVPTTRPSPASNLPQEVTEMILAHLIHDKPSLQACSLTCYSWYIATIPHLHHTLMTYDRPSIHDERYRWPRPLQNASRLGLLPLVRRFQVRALGCYKGLCPKMFDHDTLRQFSALSNVQRLEIDDLDIPNFIPRIGQYFGQFLPTLRSLSLRRPEGSSRQILFFIGLFRHLWDLELLGFAPGRFEGGSVDGSTLIPYFTPPLGGRLTMACSTRVGLLKGMIDLFGRVKFYHMDLFDVDGMRLLMDSCVETLETLRIHPTDPRAAGSFPRDFDLSRNKSLRTLEIPARCIVPQLEPCTPIPTSLDFLRATLSTITSPTFSEVVIVYRDRDFSGVGWYPARLRKTATPVERRREATWHRSQFEVFRELYAVRDFRLVLCADVWGRFGEYAVGELRRAVAVEKVAGRLDYLPSEPLVTCSPRGSWDFGTTP